LARHVRLLVALAALAALAGCGTATDVTGEDKVGRMLVAPGKYALFSCEDIAQQAATSADRARTLEQLMTKAGVDASGRLVSAMAYEPEYAERRGELNELRVVAREKNCKAVPGLDPPSHRVSDDVVR